MSETWSERRATEDDVLQVLAIEREWNPAPWSEKGFREELGRTDHDFLVITDDETDAVVVAYGVSARVRVDDDAVEILSVAVLKTTRHQGFGSRILQALVRHAFRQGGERIFLNVRRNNQPAIQLYQKNGFRITHVRKGFYTDGEDAYEMTLMKAELTP